MSDLKDRIATLVNEKKADYVEHLIDFLKIKSISTQNLEMETCANFLQSFMEENGIHTKVLRQDGAFPAVYGEVLNPNAEKTLLIYGHYDVQPEDPVELWDSDPFEPEIREETLYARGATDDKGNLLATVLALKTSLDVVGELPINLKFFFEGEEEIGSPNLEALMKENKELLAADYTILCDRGIHESGRPQIYLGNKGITNADITVRAAKRDVHSGQAPLIPNAAWQLVWLLNELKNNQDDILVPDYKEGIVQPTEEDLQLLEDIPFDFEEYGETYGIDHVINDTPKKSGVDKLIQLLYQPTTTINGLDSGYQGAGNKTVIPKEAKAKLDFRFVQGMDPLQRVESLQAFIQEKAMGDVEVSFGDIRNPSKVPPSADIVQTAIQAATEVYGREPVVWPLLDGSGPMSLFEEILDAPAIIVGLGAPFAYANTHAPNENIGIDHYVNGIKVMAYIYQLYGE